ncbi:oxygenase MpaB family protein [Mucilaginibacter sp.]|uniref:oxygenase MpaB family protein n=1 Tax=Mucilaginibacter sp. TaxID=1882438 RepID=UPI00284BD7C0|nr:oxygenase MpaB family protein [Mucilaginibacter sp.]MDR3694943.1 oxygenase MpaB family protein [Mucilaginibacter sp.]
MEKYFVDKNSIVRKIWGKADTVLFIFAGAAAEFALNKAVDWLYFTGRLPSDPLARLFSTVEYAGQIIFSEESKALASIDRITAIHQDVEKKRNDKIPDWAYRDVLYLLIDYSIRSYELLERMLTKEEKAEVFEVFLSVGNRMQLADLPVDYSQWRLSREEHLNENLIKSDFTADLYYQYKKQLGAIRYAILKQVQFQLVPARVSYLLGLKNKYWLIPLLKFYKQLRMMKLDTRLKSTLLPAAYKVRILQLDVN